MDNQLLSFLDAVNAVFKESMIAGDTLVIDESMVKSFHKNLKGTMKIIRKPRPIGNEFKVLSDGYSQIVLHVELYEGKEIMQTKKYVQDHGATTATCLRLTEYWKDSGRVVIGDSWFGSVNSAYHLFKEHRLFSILLVKTAHRYFPRDLLHEQAIQRGEWTSAKTTMDDVNLLAVRFLDLKEKQFIATASTSQVGPPRATKHHGMVSRPQVAYDYLKSCSSVDIHNHVRQGNNAFEDVWQTKNPHHRQFAGILSFIFSNAFLAMSYFKDKHLKHLDFKMSLANEMANYKEVAPISTRPTPACPIPNNLVVIPSTHQLVRYRPRGVKYQKECYYCHHAYPTVIRKPTSNYCILCGPKYPLCSNLVRNCFELHIKNGLPTKRKLPKKN